MIDDAAPWHPGRVRANPRYVPPRPPREIRVKVTHFIAALDRVTDLLNIACAPTGDPVPFIQFKTRDALTLREGIDGLLGIIAEQRRRLTGAPAPDACPLCGAAATAPA